MFYRTRIKIFHLIYYDTKKFNTFVYINLKNMKNIYFLLLALAIPSLLISQSLHGPGGIITFDNTQINSSYIMLDSMQKSNLWCISQAKKTVLNKTFSGLYAIITDSVNTYPENNISSFQIKVIGFEASSPLKLTFWHQYNTDTLRDGGFIDISYDNGKTWANIIDDRSHSIYLDSPVMLKNFYTSADTLFNGQYGFSGTSKGYIASSCSWMNCIGAKSLGRDTMTIRFNFISDSENSNKDGWIIDDIKLESGVCGSLNEFERSEFSIMPNPVEDILNIHSQKEIAYLEIFNHNGQKILTTKEKNISVSNLQSGLYMLVITGKNYKETIKFEKQ